MRNWMSQLTWRGEEGLSEEDHIGEMQSRVSKAASGSAGMASHLGLAAAFEA